MRNSNGIFDYEKADVADMAGIVGADDTNATVNMVAIADLVLPLRQLSTYEFEIILTGAVTADTNGATFQIDFSGAAGAVVEAVMIAALTNAACIAERIAALATPTTAVLTTASQAGGILIKGVITTGANFGNLSIAYNHPTAGTTTIRIGSSMKIRKLA